MTIASEIVPLAVSGLTILLVDEIKRFIGTKIDSVTMDRFIVPVSVLGVSIVATILIGLLYFPNATMTMLIRTGFESGLVASGIYGLGSGVLKPDTTSSQPTNTQTK
ncbi:MAG: hypothetical protein WCE94_12155 [Candidatus Methanoperedens sp.]